MKIILLKDTGGYKKGSNLEVTREYGKDLIFRGLAVSGEFETDKDRLILKMREEREEEKEEIKEVKTDKKKIKSINKIEQKKTK